MLWSPEITCAPSLVTLRHVCDAGSERRVTVCTFARWGSMWLHSLRLNTWSLLRNRWGGVGCDYIRCTWTHGRCYATGAVGFDVITFVALEHMVDATQPLRWGWMWLHAQEYSFMMGSPSWIRGMIQDKQDQIDQDHTRKEWSLLEHRPKWCRNIHTKIVIGGEKDWIWVKFG